VSSKDAKREGAATGTDPHGELAERLVRSTAAFMRMVSRLPGVAYSSIAWRVLGDLERRGATRVSDLAQQQRVAQPSMTALLHRLKAEGWIAKAADPEDGRASLVRLTPEGATALHDYRRACVERISPLLDTLPDRDRAALERAAELMVTLSDIE